MADTANWRESGGLASRPGEGDHPFRADRPMRRHSRHADTGHTSLERDGLPGALASLLLVGALVLGGGTRNWLFSDLVVQVLASGMLIYGLGRLRWPDLDTGARQLLILMALILAIPLLHSVPLPTALLQWVPGRAEIFAAREAVGISTPAFAAWSLDPNATLASLRALLPAAALTLLGIQIGPAWRTRFIAIIVAAALLMVAIGVAQVAQGAASELRFYTPTNEHEAVGLFANRNHYGSMLVAALICGFGGALLHSSTAHRRSQRALHLLGWLLLGAVLLLGIFLSRSRAAVGIAGLMCALLLILAVVNRKQGRNAFRWMPLIILVAGLIAMQFGLNRIAGRFENMDGGQRWDVIPGIVQLSERFAGTGTGMGSFPAVYEAYEPSEKLGARIVNHAHNDWAEVWIDAGLLAVLVLALFGHWCWQRARELVADWKRARPENAERLVGALMILSLCVHSLVDYPLRTTALSCVFVVACLLFLRPPYSADRDPETRHVRPSRA